MKKIFTIVCIIIAAVVGGSLITYYYQYQGEHFVATEDAQIKADLVTVSPQITGAVQTWTVRVGDTVTAGEILGTQETDTAKAGMSQTVAAQPSASAKAEANASPAPTTTQSPEDKLADRAQIKAPIDGKVVQVNAVVGQMVAPGTALVVIKNTNSLYIQANIKEGDINNLQEAQKVDVKIDAFPEKTYDGKVDTIGQAAQSVFSLLATSNSSGNYTKVTQLFPVKISIQNEDNDNLMPGMNASVKIYIK